MDEKAKRRENGAEQVIAETPLRGCEELVLRLHEQARARRWGLAVDVFSSGLERAVRKRMNPSGLTIAQREEFLSTLHLEDLALAQACAAGLEAAWDFFVETYRPYLRSAAAAILRASAASAEARELGDSLFAELYGLTDGKTGDRSLLRYFHGRSSLKTWLRAVLAQRHIDAIRPGRRFESLEDDESNSRAPQYPAHVSMQTDDPHHERYVTLFVRALQAALAALDPRDEQRLRLYYTKEQTLAEIGKQLGEHESSVSRNLDRIRLALRRTVEETLRNGCPAANGAAAELGLSDAQIALCFEYAAADASFDLEKLLQRRSRSSPSAGRPDP